MTPIADALSARAYPQPQPADRHRDASAGALPASQTGQSARGPDVPAGRPEPTPTASLLGSGIRVEYQQDRPVLKVHDSRGTLIYQMPSAGTLILIEQGAARDPVLSVQA